MNDVVYDPELCREMTLHNREAVNRSQQVGCYNCLKIVPAARAMWNGDTASCPNCGCIAIIPDAEVPLESGILQTMRSFWIFKERRHG